MASSEKVSARKALREATAACHDRVDAAFSGFDLTSTGGYTAFLRAQAGAFGAAEAALEAGGVERVVPDWAARRRVPMLAADLGALGAAMPEPVAAIRLDSEAALLGALYVLEGSRLGGTLLRRSVPGGLPAAFLTPGDPRMWRELIHLLDARLRTAEEIAAATKSASDVFSIFEAAGRRALLETTTGE